MSNASTIADNLVADRGGRPSGVIAATFRGSAVGLLGLALCSALILGDLFSSRGAVTAPADEIPLVHGAADALLSTSPLVEGIKLVSASLIGLLVTLVYRRTRREKPLGRAMEQAQVLLCVSGAMMMIIIGTSLARAFGIAGAASIIRFRTPVDDPKDITVLFLLMALGMATGLGAFAVAGIGTLCLCVLLVLLDRMGEPRPRQVTIELVAVGPEFPATYVQQVFAGHHITCETREIAQGSEMRVKYAATLGAGSSLDQISAELLAEGHGLKSVTWDPKKAG